MSETITTQAVREMAERLREHVDARGGPSLENGFWQRAINASNMLLALVEERDMLAEANAKKADDIVTLGQLVGKAEARAEAAEAALRETRAALEPFTTPPLYVLEGEARFVPKKMPGGWIGGGWFSSGDFRRAITAYHRTSHVTLQGRDEMSETWPSNDPGAPISRERQIELMQTAEERVKASLEYWRSKPKVQRSTTAARKADNRSNDGLFE